MEAILYAYLLLTGLVFTALFFQKRQPDKQLNSSSVYKEQWKTDDSEKNDSKEPSNESKVTIFFSGASLLLAGYIMAYVISNLSVNQPIDQFSGQLFYSSEDAFYYALSLLLGGVGTRGWGAKGFSMLMYSIIGWQILGFIYTASSSEDTSLIFFMSGLVIFFSILAVFRLSHSEKKQAS